MTRRTEPIILTRGSFSVAWTLESLTPSGPMGSEQRSSTPGFLWPALIASVVIGALLLIVAGGIFAFTAYEVEGASMSPGLPDGRRVVVNKLAYRSLGLGLPGWLPLGGDPQRGDLVVFQSPAVAQADLVKRVIGLPGETVTITPRTGQVLVDGRPLDEPYAIGPTHCSGLCRWSVPAGSYFVLGDSRAKSSDSRLGWFIPKQDIIGAVILEY